MILTEQCAEQDAKVLVLILWQKLSELWVSIVFEADKESENNDEESNHEEGKMNKLYENNKEDKRTSVLRNINSNILLKNIKRLMFGFKNKLGIKNNSSNEFVKAN